MVVVMRPGAAPEDVAAVVARVESAGGSAFISRGVQRTIVGLVGDVVAFAGLNLRAMPGVGEVVRVSKPYKLVSRETTASTSSGVAPGRITTTMGCPLARPRAPGGCPGLSVWSGVRLAPTRPGVPGRVAVPARAHGRTLPQRDRPGRPGPVAGAEGAGSRMDR